jgi:hypothetical protein
MPLKCITRITGIAGLALLLQGASGAGAAEQAGIEPRAADILKSALTHLAGSPSFRIRSEVITEIVLPSGQRLHYPGRLELAVRRPDRLWYKLDSSQRRIAAWYDGSSFTLLDSDRNTCASTPAPKGLGQLFDDMATRLGFRPPLSVLLRDDSTRVVLERMISGFYVGRDELEGQAYHHLAFQQANVDLEFWVAADGAPLLKRVVITQKKLPTRPQLSYTIVAWEPGATLDEALFRFEPPADVIRCDFQSLTK